MSNFLKSEQYIDNHRDETIETMSHFAETDMLFFWSNDSEIFRRQQGIWQPFLDNFQKQNNVKINVSNDLSVPDNKKYLSILKNKLMYLTNRQLTAAFLASLQLKSVILGLAILDEKLSVEDIFKADFLEELYQNEYWGTDAEACAKRESMKNELVKIRDYLHNG